MAIPEPVSVVVIRVAAMGFSLYHYLSHASTLVPAPLIARFIKTLIASRVTFGDSESLDSGIS